MQGWCLQYGENFVGMVTQSDENPTGRYVPDVSALFKQYNL